MRMEELIKENIKMIKNMVLEFILGQTVRSMMEDGLKANNMDKPNSPILKAKASLVCGNMVKERNG
jgi:hypothetical protein